MSRPIPRTLHIRDAAADLLHRLHAGGWRVAASAGGRLAYDAPPGHDPADLDRLARLRRHALDLLATLDDLDAQHRIDRLPRRHDRERVPTVPMMPDRREDVRRRLLDATAGADAGGFPLPGRPAERVACWQAFCRNAPTPDVLAVARWFDLDAAADAEGGGDA